MPKNELSKTASAQSLDGLGADNPASKGKQIGAMMRKPSELMSKNYCGPSKVIPLGQIQNTDGFRFIGIDKDGGEHYCIVRLGDGGSFYMNSNTIMFQDMIGWVPDTQAPNVKLRG